MCRQVGAAHLVFAKMARCGHGGIIILEVLAVQFMQWMIMGTFLIMTRMVIRFTRTASGVADFDEQKFQVNQDQFALASTLGIM
jgi:hypothetical protein